MTLKKLIYRELYLSKKNILICLGIGIMCFLFAVLLLLSCRFGNFAKYNEPDKIREIMNSVSAYLPIMLYSIFMVEGVDAIPNQIFTDRLCGWHKFIRSSEVKAKDYVGAKYAAILILFAGATLLMFIVCPVFFLLSGTKEINLTGLIAVLDFVLFFTDYNLPLFFWAKTREKAMLWSSVPIFAVALIGIVAAPLTAAKFNDADLIDVLIEKYLNGNFMQAVCIVFGILAVLLYVSYRLSVHFVEVEG